MHERHWQFRLHDDTVVDCSAYFSKRAGEVAEALNCELVASNVVKIQELQGNVRRIMGTALLQNQSENVLKFKRDHIRLP
jgi:hypothetical protein